MFLLSILPAFLIHSLLMIGLAGVIVTTFFSIIPFIGAYLKQIQILAIILLVASVWLEGGLAEKKDFEAKTAKVEIKTAKKETVAAETTTQIVIKYVDRIKTIKEKGDTIYVKVPEVITKYDTNCQLPNAFTFLYDNSNKAEVSDTSGTANETARSSSKTSVSK